ncbi:retention module-containing protein [Citrobacter freundii]|uniref:retention module-containing protein n=1 Tax=Citrobacter freundii TaxID=546 RepID=UPI0015F5BDDD|nr:retention module-containing protein [Citrobacter freundii]
MSKLLGVIKAIIGQVYVVEANGTQRLVHEGDRISLGEEIVTGAGGAVSISLPNGQTVDIGRNSHWGEHGIQVSHNPNHDAQDIAAVQKAIADGADPTQILDATAAGNDEPVPMEGGGGGHTRVQLELTGQVVDPTAGFGTKGLGSPNGDINLPVAGILSGSASLFPPEVTIAEFAGNDGYINKNEFRRTHLSGTSNQNHVTLTFTDSQKNTFTVDVPVRNGHWFIDTDLGGLQPGNVTVVATATDVSGRTAQTFDNALIDITGPRIDITVDNVTPDNLINYEESLHTQTIIHGHVGGDAKPGDIVTLLVDGKEYTGIVTDPGNGPLTYNIPVLTHGLLNDPTFHATLTSTDDAGNTTTVSTEHHVESDLLAQNAVTIETVANDDVVNASENRMPTLITGVASGDAKAGDPVTLTVQGKEFHGTVFDDHGQLRYEIEVPRGTLKEGVNDVQVKVVSHDDVGNEATAVTHKNVVLDTLAADAISIDTVADDNIVNRSESRMPTLISGAVTGDAQPGDPVAVQVNGQTFNGVVVTDEHGALRYNVAVPTSALHEGRNDVQVTVTGVDTAGNTAVAVQNTTVTLDTQAANAISIDTVADDNTVNRSESRMPTLISGAVTGDAQPGDPVAVQVNGQTFNGVVVTDEHGALRYNVAVPTSALHEGRNDVQVTVTGVDTAGNTAVAVQNTTVTLDTQAANAISIDTVADDNTVNRSESRMPTLISGAVTGDAQPGDPVAVQVNGQTFNGVVVTDEHGALRYNVAVPTSALHEGRNGVQVTVTGVDTAGNTAVAVQNTTVTLDTQAANAISIDTVADDNTVNRSESRMPTLISGAVTGDAQPGDPVAVQVNGQTFNGVVVADEHGALRYNVAVPTSALHEGRNDVQVTVTGVDTAGNTAVAVQNTTVTLDTVAANAISIDTVADDNIVNRSESRMPTLIAGAVTGDAQPGDPVAVQVNGQTFNGVVVTDEHGALRYNVAVPTSALHEGRNDVQVTVTGVDTAGNTAVAVQNTTVTLDTQAANAISIDTVADDNIVNRSESRMPTLIAGAVTGDAQPGDPVAVQVNGQTFNGVVVTDEHGALRYNVAVPTSALHEGRNDVQVTVTGVDTAGNTAVAVQNTTVTLDTQAANAISIDTVADDNTVNRSESRMPTLIAGAVTGDAQPGDPVAVQMNGQTFNGVVVTDEHGALRYNVAVPISALHEGRNGVQVTVTGVDTAGNTAVAVQNTTVTLDTVAANAISIDTVADDNIVNRSESRMPTLIAGAVTGDAQPGDPVAVQVNGQTFNGVVVTDEHGALRYNVAVPTSALHEGRNDVLVTVTGVDTAGNTAVAVQNTTVTLDTQAANAISIDTVADDNIVNRSESRMPTLISGAVTGDAQPGDPVAVQVNGQTFNGVVVTDEHGALRYHVAVPTSALHEGRNDVQVTVTGVDTAGNTAVTVQNTTVTLDTQAANAISIDTVADDNIVNRSESRMPTLISGAVTGDAQPGDPVAVQVNGQTFNGVVVTDEHGALRYNVAVPTSALHEGRNDVQVTVTGVDTAGNTAVAVQNTTVTLDTQAADAISIDTVADDNTVNRSESRMPTLIAGAVTGDAQPGDPVAVQVNGQTFNGVVVTDEHGALRYNVAVPTSALHEGRNDVQVTVTGVDTAGNTAVAVQNTTVTLDTEAHNGISIDDVTVDNTLNFNELSAKTRTITGTVSGEDARAGDRVDLVINGHDYHGRVIDLGNGSLGYSIAVDSAAFADNSGKVLKDVDVHASVVSQDAAGNEAVAVSTHTVHLDNYAENGVDIRPVATDDVVNATENRMPTMISGKVGGPDARAGDVVTVSVQGKTFTGTVVNDNGHLRYEVAVPTGTLLPGRNGVVVTVVSHDKAGNEVTALDHRTVVLDTEAHNAISIDDVTVDNTLNFNELSAKTRTITGTVSGEDARAGDRVDLVINGHDYHGRVIDLGNGSLGYSIAVDSAAFADNSGMVLKDVDVHASVVSQDAAGNVAVAVSTHTVHLDNYAENGVDIRPVATDDVVNATENRMPTMISGKVGGPDARAGDVVTVSVQGQTFTGTVVNDNGHLRYEVAVPTGTLKEGRNGVVVTVLSHDKAGNEVTAQDHRTVVLDTEAHNALTIDDVTADNILNRSELYMRHQVVTGTVSGEDARAGDRVDLVINGHDYHGRVIDLGNGSLGYRIAVDSAAFADNSGKVLKDVDVHASVVSQDAAGNEAVAVSTHTVHLDNYAENQVHIDKVAVDDIINIKEFSENGGFTHITGTVTGIDAKAGDVVTLELKGGYTLTTTVIALAGGGLGYSFPVNTHMLITHPEINVTVTSSDAAGNHVTHSASKAIDSDMYTQSHITIDGVTADNVINIKESTDNNGQTKISGTVSGDAKLHDTVELMIDGHRYSGFVEALPGGNLGYHILVDTQSLVNDPVIHARINTTDNHGNESTATTERTVGLDLNASASIGIDTVAGDDIISHAESLLNTTTITGPVGGDAKPGDVVTLTFNNQTWHGSVVVLADGSLGYSIPVSTKNLPDGVDQNVHVSISTVDEHGNQLTVSHDHTVHIDLHADAKITIDKVTDDNVLNHFELDKPKQLVSGTVGGDAQVGDAVNIEINGYTFTGKVIDLGGGKLGYQIPVDSAALSNNQGNQDKNVTFTATVTSHDAVGNEVTIGTSHTVHIDNHARAGITVDTVAGDDVLNGAEAARHTTEVMGTVSGDVKFGDKVQIIVNGHTYNTTVQHLPEHNGALGYKLDVLTRDLLKDPHIIAQVNGVDTPHNIQHMQTPHDLTVDLHAKAMLSIDPVTGDNRVNGDESHQPFTWVTGKVAGDVHVNDVVYLTVKGHVLTGKVVDLGGGVLGYSIKVSTADLLADPHLTATVSTTDAAGNVAKADAETTVIIDTRVDAAIKIDAVTPDNTLNRDEQMQGHTLVSGTVTGEVHPGDPLVMTINGQIYTGVVEDLGGNKMGFHISVATSDIIASPHIDVSMDVTDAAQNHAHITAHHNVGLDDKAYAAITIDPVTGDKVLNGAELQKTTTVVSGTVGGDAKAGDIVHLNIGGHLVDTQVIPLPNLGGTLGYSVDVATQWLQHDPHITATITATDPHGNSATAQAQDVLTIDDHAVATVHINPIVTADHDSVINYNEAHNPLTTVTGTVGGDVLVGDWVELTVNNQVYYAQVQDSNGQHTFSADVSTLDLLLDPHIHAEVSATDAAGNVAYGHDDRPVVIDTHADARITIDSMTTGLLPNMTTPQDLAPGRKPDYVIVTGHVDPDAKLNDEVILIVGNGIRYTTHVIELPNHILGFQASVSTGDLGDNGNITVSITTHDDHGNTATATDHKLIDLPWTHNQAVSGNTPYIMHNPPAITTPPTGTGTTVPHQPQVHLTVDKVTGDDVLNHDEVNNATTPVRGRVTGDVHANDVVTVTVNGVDYHGKVFAIPGLSGEFGYQVDVPSNVLQAHPTFDVSVTVTEGNLTGSDTQHKVISIDTDNPITINMNPVASDDVINGKEALTGKTMITGTVKGEGLHDGSVVSLQVNGNTLTTVVHNNNGTLEWSKEVSINDLRTNPTIVATVTGTDAAGNTVTGSTDRHLIVDLNAVAGVTIDNITADNVLNAQESDVTVHPTTTVTGSVTGDVKSGDIVTLEVDNHTYTATVDNQLHYSVDIDTQHLNADHSIVAKVTGHDVHGNDQDASYTKNFTRDTTAAATVTINTVGGDDVINADEVKAGQIEVSGTVGGDVHKGDKVHITVNNITVDADVVELPHMNGQLGYSALVSTAGLQTDPTIYVSVTGEDAAKNTQTANSQKPVTIDTNVVAEIHLDKVSDDDVLNNAQTKLQHTKISGYVTGDVDVGDLVTIRVGGKDLVAKVTSSGGKKVFSVDASTVDLVHDQNITAHVTAHDDAGNRQEIDTAKTLTIDREAKGTVDIDNVTADNVLNQQELQALKTTITGTVGGDAQKGDPVVLTIGNRTFNGSVDVLPSGKLGYQIDVDTDVLKANTSIDAKVTGHDAPGNPYSIHISHSYVVDDHAEGTIVINNGIAGDNAVNQTESQHDTVISGVVTGDAKMGDSVTLTVNSFSTTVKVTQDPHSNKLVYAVAVPTSALNEGDNDVQVKTTVKDAAGNTLDVTNHKTVVLDTHADATIVVDKITGDNHISQAESQNAITHLTGSVTGDVHDGEHITARVNGHQYDTVIHLNNNELRYDFAVDTSTLRTGHNRVSVMVEANDNHGNTTTHAQMADVTMEDHAPVKAHAADKGQHAAAQHALHNLFDDSALSLSYAPAASAHGQAAAVLGPDDKAKAVLDKVDLSDLARELHEGVDIAKYIQSGGDHHLIASPAKVAHGIDTAVSTPLSSDVHASTYSLDHLIAKPEQNHSH